MDGRALHAADLVWAVTLVAVGASWWFSSRRPVGVATPAHPSQAAEPGARPGTLSVRFDPKANGLNLIRLVLALAVLLWHSYPLTGRAFDAGALTAPLGRLLSEGPVDAFFAVSGFLIAGSWVRRPRVADFVRSRFLRLMPAFLVCLVVTVVVIAPLGILLGDRPISAYLPSAVRYVVVNASLDMVQWDVAGTPSGVPWRHAWDGSLWTLQWEAFCYAGVLLLGVTGLLRRRWPVLLTFVGFTALAVLVDAEVWTSPLGVEMARLGTMFAAGALVFTLRDRLPVNRWTVAAALACVVACLGLHDYRVPGALPLAYLLVAVSTVVRSPRLQLRTDISYGVYIYAFPVQQLLALSPLLTAPLPAFVVAAVGITVGMALLSWHLVEKRALAHRHVVPAAGTPPQPAVSPPAPSPTPSPTPQASIRNSV